MVDNWPLDSEKLRLALGYQMTADDKDELTLFITAACDLIDRKTGRDLDPNRWLVGNSVPTIFILAARETAKLWWQQTKNGPRNRPPQGEDTVGPPMGADLPRKVQSWLADYPPRLYVEQTT